MVMGKRTEPNRVFLVLVSFLFSLLRVRHEEKREKKRDEFLEENSKKIPTNGRKNGACSRSKLTPISSNKFPLFGVGDERRKFQRGREK